MALCLCTISICHSLVSQSQANLKGLVVNLSDQEPLSGTSITLYSSARRSSLVANKEGKFSISASDQYDSVKFSMVGYYSKVYVRNQLQGKDSLKVELETAAPVLKEIVVKPLTGIEIVREAVAKIAAMQPSVDFENKGFYREVIKDSDHYYSIAEAIFTAQYFPGKKDFKLQLDRGRTAEDVSSTSLFEDFHPGGGPQSVARNSFTVERPDFLNPKKLSDFIYRLDSIVEYDGRRLYRIQFDQKENVREALDKGTLYIEQEEMAIVRYECVNSPRGTPYIKSLTGSDKLFAKLLNINLERKGWRRRVDFSKIGSAWMLTYAEAEYQLEFQQLKKNIDLDLNISTELLMTDLSKAITKEIAKSDEWKRKNLIANLPTAFDTAFWGQRDIISPTEKVRSIVAELSQGAHPTNEINGWQYLNRNLFVAWSNVDAITMIPVMRSSWEDKDSAGLLYREVEGDFVMEAEIRLSKNSDSLGAPDKGFQQAGLMIRNNAGSTENYVFVSAGTGGNPNPKVFFKKTVNGKSKTVSVKKGQMNGWLRIERKGNKIMAYQRAGEVGQWEKIGESKIDWIVGKLQIGLAVFASFTGQGPKMIPDMKAEFSRITIDPMS